MWARDGGAQAEVDRTPSRLSRQECVFLMAYNGHKSALGVLGGEPGAGRFCFLPEGEKKAAREGGYASARGDLASPERESVEC
jgi:hypothetical protein